MRLWKHRSLKFCGLPRPTAVGGYFDPADGACSGPSQASDLVKSRGPNPLSAGRACDNRIRPKFELEPARFAVRILALLHNSLGGIGLPLLKVGPVHHLDSSQKFYAVDCFIAGD